MINPRSLIHIVVADFAGNANPYFYRSLFDKINEIQRVESISDIGLWIINAGVMTSGDFDKVDIHATKAMIDVNVY